jgi:hypothetical protein
MKIITILLALCLFTSLTFAQVESITSFITLTFDTTKTISNKSVIYFTGATGYFNFYVACDSTGGDEGTSDSLAVYYKTLSDSAGSIIQMQDNWSLAEIYNGTGTTAGSWVNWLDWTDATKYRMDFPDLSVCKSCSLYASFGTGDSLIATLKIGYSFLKLK